MYNVNKTEQEKLVDAATWKELEDSPLDHLLLPTGQTAYCMCGGQSCDFVAQLTGGLVFYLKNYTCLCSQPRIFSWRQFKVKSAFVLFQNSKQRRS